MSYQDYASALIAVGYNGDRVTRTPAPGTPEGYIYETTAAPVPKGQSADEQAAANYKPYVPEPVRQELPPAPTVYVHEAHPTTTTQPVKQAQPVLRDVVYTNPIGSPELKDPAPVLRDVAPIDDSFFGKAYKTVNDPLKGAVASAFAPGTGLGNWEAGLQKDRPSVGKDILLGGLEMIKERPAEVAASVGIGLGIGASLGVAAKVAPKAASILGKGINLGFGAVATKQVIESENPAKTIGEFAVIGISAGVASKISSKTFGTTKATKQPAKTKIIDNNIFTKVTTGSRSVEIPKQSFMGASFDDISVGIKQPSLQSQKVAAGNKTISDIFKPISKEIKTKSTELFGTVQEKANLAMESKKVPWNKQLLPKPKKGSAGGEARARAFQENMANKYPTEGGERIYIGKGGDFDLLPPKTMNKIYEEPKPTNLLKGTDIVVPKTVREPIVIDRRIYGKDWNKTYPKIDLKTERMDRLYKKPTKRAIREPDNLTPNEWLEREYGNIPTFGHEVQKVKRRGQKLELLQKTKVKEKPLEVIDLTNMDALKSSKYRVKEKSMLGNITKSRTRNVGKVKLRNKQIQAMGLKSQVASIFSPVLLQKSGAIMEYKSGNRFIESQIAGVKTGSKTRTTTITVPKVKSKSRLDTSSIASVMGISKTAQRTAQKTKAITTTVTKLRYKPIQAATSIGSLITPTKNIRNRSLFGGGEGNRRGRSKKFKETTGVMLPSDMLGIKANKKSSLGALMGSFKRPRVRKVKRSKR